jgi:hypothetical protein
MLVRLEGAVCNAAARAPNNRCERLAVEFLGFINSVVAAFPRLRGSRDPRPEYPISIPITFAPTL